MNKISLTFTVNQQELKNTTKSLRLASGTVDYVDATFELGDNWDSFDSVRAIWTKRADAYSTVLDAYGYCKVPTELLADKGTIKVNLVGSISETVDEEEVLTDRLTTFSTTALSVSQLVPLEGGETSPLTPSQFEQFVLIVQGYSEDAVTAKEAAETAQALAETAKTGAENAMTSAVSAKESAQGYAQDASGSADSASQSATASQGFASDASNYADSASTSADNASASATSASGYATTASGYADDAHDEAVLARSYARGDTSTRTGEATDNAKYYSEQSASSASDAETAKEEAEAIAESMVTNLVDGSATGSVRGVGTVEESSSYSLGDYAFAEGYATKASGNVSHAEGAGTTASGGQSHAEGAGTIASGQNSHAEGGASVASGLGSHAEGLSTQATGTSSHAQNGSTIAQGLNQTAIGTYNEAQGTGSSKVDTDYAFIIGNGTSPSNRSNAFTVKWNGDVNASGEITDGTGNTLSDKVDSVSGKGLSTEDYTAAEKTKLSGIEDGAEVNPTIDTELSTESTNPVQNKAIAEAINNEAEARESVNEALLKLAVHDEASGSIASFDDGSDGFPMDSLKVTLEPVQAGSGTPSPDNVRPITGWDEVNTVVCGVNVWDEEWALGYWSYRNNGVFVANSDFFACKDKIPVKPNTEYFWQTPLVVRELLYYDQNEDYIGRLPLPAAWQPESFTTPSNCYYVTFYYGGAYGSVYNNDISINYPSTDHDYHAYQGRTITTTFSQTVYGGTLDVVTGELVADRAMVDLGTLNWGFSTADRRFFNNTIDYDRSNPNAICSQYQSVPLGSLVDGTFCAYSNGYLYLKDYRYTDAQSFKTAMDGVQFCYNLATTTTTQLTPTEVDTLLGTNNVWSDGDVYVKYVADTKLYILKVIQ